MECQGTKFRKKFQWDYSEEVYNPKIYLKGLWLSKNCIFTGNASKQTVK